MSKTAVRTSARRRHKVRRRSFSTVWPHTGQKVRQAGIYRGLDSCHREIHVKRGSSFPPCHMCYKATSWKIVKRGPGRPVKVHQSAA